MKKIKWILLVPILFLLIYPITYIPKKLVKIDPSEVAKITIFDGNTGYEEEILDKKSINYIITNLNSVTFKKGKSSFGYMGYSFNTTIVDHNGKTIKELTINTEDTIRYKGFFYTAVDQLIDYDYIEKLVRKTP